MALDGDMSYTVVGGGIRDAIDSLKNILEEKIGKPDVKSSEPMANSTYGGLPLRSSESGRVCQKEDTFLEVSKGG